MTRWGWFWARQPPPFIFVRGGWLVELHQQPAVTMLVVGLAFLNGTEACLEPAPDGSFIPQIRIDGYAFASCVRSGTSRVCGRIRSERTPSGRGDQEHVEAAHVDCFPKPRL